MPTTRSSTDLRNSYNEQLVGRFELYGLLQEGLNDIAEGKARPFSEAMSDLRSQRK